MSDYPALFDCVTKSLVPLQGSALFTVGRTPDADLPVQDVACSRYQFRLVLDGNRYHVEGLSPNSPTQCNGQVVLRRTPLAHGTELRAGNCRFRFLERPDSAFAPAKLTPSEQALAQAHTIPPRPAPPPPAPPRPAPPPAAPPRAAPPPPAPPAPPRVIRTPMPPAGPPTPVPPSSAPAPKVWFTPAPTPMSAPAAPPPSEPPPTAGTVLMPKAGGPASGASSPRGATVLAGATTTTETGPLSVPGSIPLTGTMLIGREAGRVDVLLAHPHISRIHAQITMQGNKAIVSDLRSANGTFVNGIRVRFPVPMRPGDRIDVGPYSLLFTGNALVQQSRENNVELIGRRLQRVVTDRATGQPRFLLEDVTVVIRPHEFVCLLGPSGAGKSTLLSALSGRAPADGAVLLNGKNLYANFESLKRDLVVVAQKDVLHDSLTVERAIWYTAKLRLPPDTRNDEIRSYIDEMLNTVGLTAQRATPISALSGGQIKRTSLANELLSKPTLLFLDEVTSGLDEQTDRDMMQLFRSLADTGKTVVCVTHSLANVEQYCHLVVILATGGKLAFLGKPSEALQYFSINRLGDVYEKLSERPAQEWQERFAQSPYHAHYVESRLPPESDSAETTSAEPMRLTQRACSVVRQSILLTRRYLDITLNDFRALIVMFGQALLVAALLLALFGNLEEVTAVYEHAQRSLTLMFLMEISCFWFGCNNAAKEVVKERVIYSRERDFNLNISSYYASKFILLTLLTVLQVALLWAIVQLLCKPPGNAAGVLLLLATMGVAGVALGLAASCVASSSDVAVSLIPIALIPQIILAGVISPLKEVSRWLAKGLTTCYWGDQGLKALMPDKVLDYAQIERYPLWKSYSVLGAHMLVFIIIGIGMLFWQDRRARRRSGGGRKLRRPRGKP